MVPPPSVVLGPESEHSRPEPSLHGVSFGGVAVGHALQEVVVVGDCLDGDRIADFQVARQAHLEEAVADLIGAGELGGGVGGKQFHRRGPRTVQHRIGHATLKCSSPVLPRQPMSP